MTPRRLFSLLFILALAGAAALPAAAQDAAPSDGAEAAAKVAPAKKTEKAKKAKKAKKKDYDYDNSKYKAYKELVADDGAHSYRFDEHGNPIPVGGKKKAAAKKKKKADDDAGSCEAGDTCQDDANGAESKASVDPAE